MMRHLSGHCTCNAIAFRTGRPLFRALCHCSICKNYHNRDYADFTVFLRRQVQDNARGKVTYTVYKQPPLLQRGTCDLCSAPILEKLFIPGLPRLMLIPSRWISEHAELPPPSLHMFYNQRTHEARDTLPKANGYLASQLLFARHLMPALLGRKPMRDAT